LGFNRERIPDRLDLLSRSAANKDLWADYGDHRRHDGDQPGYERLPVVEPRRERIAPRREPRHQVVEPRCPHARDDARSWLTKP
jgi:hypothetical protein